MAQSTASAMGADIMAKLQLSRSGAATTDKQQAKPHQGAIMRESSFRNTLQALRRKSQTAGAAGDGGFTTFTSGIRAGWQRELASARFRQVSWWRVSVGWGGGRVRRDRGAIAATAPSPPSLTITITRARFSPPPP